MTTKAKAGKKNRVILVVDRGWIFAGDLTVLKDKRLRLDRAVWVFRWATVGFSAVVADPSTADIRPIDPVEVPADAEIFRIPVLDTWGLK
jgi:hypothetical protein